MHAAEILQPLRRPPALFGAALVALSAAIVANALLLQPRPHPTPLVSTRSPAEIVPAAAAPPARDLVVEAVQAALRNGGRYAGPVDGIPGPLTQAAIRAFEAEAGLTPTGVASPDLLAAIEATGEGSAEAAAGASSVPPTGDGPDGLVAQVQRALARAAYGPLTADGVFGPETREAIERFQRDHGLAPTGEIGDALVVELRAAGAMED